MSVDPVEMETSIKCNSSGAKAFDYDGESASAVEYIESCYQNMVRHCRCINCPAVEERRKKYIQIY